MEKKRKRWRSGLLWLVLLFVADQATKYAAQAYLSGTRSVTLIPGVFQLYYLENRGAAFGMLADRQWFFILVALVMLAAVVYVYLRLPSDHHYDLLRLVCVLIAAGAVGNMTDRLLHRYVIDFLYVSLIDFPVFNIADCYVCIGAFLGIVSFFTVYKDDELKFLTK
jgi:signal peptidase II